MHWKSPFSSFMFLWSSVLLIRFDSFFLFFLCFHSYSLLFLNQLQTVEILPCPGCVQLCLNLNRGYRTNKVRWGTFLRIWQIGGEKMQFSTICCKTFQWQLETGCPSCLSIFQSFSASICFSCWVVFIIINNIMIIVMIIIIAAAALWLL